MRIEELIVNNLVTGLKVLYGVEISTEGIQLQKTRPEFEGDLTVAVFPFVRASKKSPEMTSSEIGEYLRSHVNEIESFNVIKGFLNLVISGTYWLENFIAGRKDEHYGFGEQKHVKPVVVEYSSPNTNKPLHLGHVRNNLLGWSIAEILKANGYPVVKVNLVNDRGIHICKTMLAWQKWGNGTDPGKAGMKGDKLVGDLYVKFESANKSLMEELKNQGMTEEEAYKNSGLIKEANELLRRWEEGEKDVRELWNRMNGWVYAGFDATYKRMGVDFEKIYHESDTYLLGKEIVKEGLEKGVFSRRGDGSVWIDLTDEGLDEKLLLRSDGTSVYMTQDLGTAQLRYDDYTPSRLLYVVGNEQNYHFDVLKLVLKKLGREWADDILHVSYGMVELPQGRMKSREGTVVDADDLMEEMHRTAKKLTEELGKTGGEEGENAEKLFEMVGMGALKYFILRVDPKKNMLFNPEESIDFNGNTGPFIQYTYARIQSLIAKGKERGFDLSKYSISSDHQILPKEKDLLKALYAFPQVIKEAGANLSPALIANYAFELAKEYNQYYQEVPVLRAASADETIFRIAVAEFTGQVLRKAAGLLGMEVPERM